MFAGLRLSAFRRGARRALAASFVAGLATIAAPPAWSGIKPVEEQPIAMRAAEAYYNYFSEHVPGMVEPLIDYSGEELPPVKCDLNAKPKVHAILIGASNSAEPFGKLAGPDNDVELLYTSLTARGAADDDIALMIGEYAGREALAEIFVESLGRVNCGDRALVHFGGNSVRSTDIVGLVPDEIARRSRRSPSPTSGTPTSSTTRTSRPGSCAGRRRPGSTSPSTSRLRASST